VHNYNNFAKGIISGQYLKEVNRMKRSIALILSLVLVISVAGCGKAAAETTAKTAGNEAAVITVAGESSAAAAIDGAIEKDPRNRLGIGLGVAEMYFPGDWMKYTNFSYPLIYGPKERFIKNDEDMPLYYLVIDSYLSSEISLDSSLYADLTFEDVHQLAFENIQTSGPFANYTGENLIGTETSQEEVTVGDIDYLKVVGKSTEGFMEPNYIAYFGFYSDEEGKIVHFPFYMVIFIASDDAEDISKADEMVKAFMATMEPF